MANSLHHSFNVELAEKYGIECAILIHHLQFWIEQNQTLGRNFHDGRTWMYQTQHEIAAIYPYWNRDKVQDILQKLIDEDVIIKGNYSKNPMDRTSWYAFQNEKIFTKVRNSTMDVRNSTMQGAEPHSVHIPYSKPYSKPQILKTMVPDSGKKTLDSSILKRKTMDPIRRWKLTNSQAETFHWLKEQEINSEDKKLAWWAKTYSLQRLIDVFKEAKVNKADSVGAYMSSLLEKSSKVPNSHSEQNREFVTQYKEIHGWHSLKILKNYVRFPLGNDSYDLDFNMEPTEFAKTLMSKHNYENNT